MPAKHSTPPALQLPLELDTSEPLPEQPSEPVPVSRHSTLAVARVWFRRHLEEQGRLANTIESYIYDLVVLEQRVGDKPISRINETDVAGFLADASSKVTRKRRITSLKALYGWLIEDLHVLDISPAANFSPHPLDHTLPATLSPAETEALLAAAQADTPWSATAIWLMVHLGLGRNELLALERHHIDRTPAAGPEIEIRYASAAKRTKDRTLQATREFGELYTAFLEQTAPESVLFPYGPQAVNGMVDRVSAAAGIKRKVTPQLLRHTAAVAIAATGLSVNQLLGQLGLANDARNRETVRLYQAAAGRFDEAKEEDNV